MLTEPWAHMHDAFINTFYYYTEEPNWSRCAQSSLIISKIQRYSLSWTVDFLYFCPLLAIPRSFRWAKNFLNMAGHSSEKLRYCSIYDQNMPGLSWWLMEDDRLKCRTVQRKACPPYDIMCRQYRIQIYIYIYIYILTNSCNSYQY